nr:uncharacterized protein LOC125421745 isoform X1 [Ziziphus jujuba var. spinosa]
MTVTANLPITKPPPNLGYWNRRVSYPTSCQDPIIGELGGPRSAGSASTGHGSAYNRLHHQCPRRRRLRFRVHGEGAFEGPPILPRIGKKGKECLPNALQYHFFQVISSASSNE